MQWELIRSLPGVHRELTEGIIGLPGVCRKLTEGIRSLLRVRQELAEGDRGLARMALGVCRKKTKRLTERSLGVIEKLTGSGGCTTQVSSCITTTQESRQ
ncbi:hypothetical protein GW17_00014982 [Ensete ventricosum]|nr:hypothetical protein GW17_00014982 [Ensete ventricosum]